MRFPKCIPRNRNHKHTLNNTKKHTNKLKVVEELMLTKNKYKIRYNNHVDIRAQPGDDAVNQKFRVPCTQRHLDPDGKTDPGLDVNFFLY